MNGDWFSDSTGKWYRPVTQAADVTEALVETVESWTDTMDGPIEWEYLWDRLDGTVLMEYSTDGRLRVVQTPEGEDLHLDFGSEYDSPAMRKIQRTVRSRRNS